MAPDRVRVSVGTASVLGLLRYRLAVPPTTAYIMTYTEGSCLANCSFCAQARGHQGNRDQLSRVVWPDYPMEKVLEGFRSPTLDVLQRVCVQVINYPGFLDDTVDLISLFRAETGLPVSVDICPITREGLGRLRDVGAEMISIPLDGATHTIFDRVKGRGVKGPYRWESHLETLRAAVEVFGEGNVGSNLIVGLGETEREAVELIQMLHDMKVRTVLFAFTPLEGTMLEGLPQPPLGSYRRIQAARHFIVNGYASIGDMTFNGEGRIMGFGGVDLGEALRDGVAFMTTGCPGCNRPFYNERPSGPFYNYPRPLTPEEVREELGALASPA
ncbi:radical SAM protein [Candidatus Bathyarchaeota archaeon]|nr:radical SAM protein [Candidatus Bathyarchaeota archaeon]